MTVDELTKLIDAAFRGVPFGHDTPDNIEAMVAEIANWMHISQKGFDRSDLEHMKLEAAVIGNAMQRLSAKLADLSLAAKDEEDTL